MQHFFSALSSDTFVSMAEYYTDSGSCSECFQYITDACSLKEFTIITGLSAGTSICWQITDKFGEIWRGVGVVDTDEMISIPVAPFPAGMFNQHAGIFIFEILALGEIPPAQPVCEGIPFTICGNDYSCIAFSFVSTSFISARA